MLSSRYHIILLSSRYHHDIIEVSSFYHHVVITLSSYHRVIIAMSSYLHNCISLANSELQNLRCTRVVAAHKSPLPLLAIFLDFWELYFYSFKLSPSVTGDMDFTDLGSSPLRSSWLTLDSCSACITIYNMWHLKHPIKRLKSSHN